MSKNEVLWSLGVFFDLNDHPPWAATSENALNTSLLLSRNCSQTLKQGTVAVTYDQPNFHLLMAYLGAIGHIMKSSGIEELFATVYAGNSIKDIMSGKKATPALSEGHGPDSFCCKLSYKNQT
ncbi:hypothetical protein KQX54_000599 [Cotesia glomerata]|uniref:Uncharacterized protein n=1 Tax=Cotesia glomerata TaxID=32391 RepID=A0AAV7IPR2_COTGL|nr:hypothetical protein KQX54_000599 [Cotesia glomerata]